jgi:hypothetical protein
MKVCCWCDDEVEEEFTGASGSVYCSDECLEEADDD